MPVNFVAIAVCLDVAVITILDFKNDNNQQRIRGGT